MTRPSLPHRPIVLLGGLLLAGALSCGREVTGPDGGGRAAAIQLDPRFRTIRLEGTGQELSIGSIVTFERVRVILRRADGSIAVDTMVDFPATAESVTLRLTVQLSSDATAAGELLSATMKYIDAGGDTVFSGGPVEVTAKPASSGTAVPVEVDIGYVGPGSRAASIEITPATFTGYLNDAPTFTAIVRDSSALPLTVAPVAFTSTDSNRVRVNLRTGAATLLGARGGAMIIAQTLTGQADTATVGITPVATSLVLISGGGQQERQGDPFQLPIRVRANAVDGLGVPGVVVAFTVLQGQGSTSQPFDTTDANGDAEVGWVAGDSAGPAVLRAAIYETLIGVNVNATQLSSAATGLTFSASPTNFTAGATIPAMAVVVRDAIADTVSSFNGQVSLALAGGTVGANLVGSTTVNAVGGVALFTGLTVDRAGTGYRLVATLPALPAVPPVQTATFNVAAAPPANLIGLSGAGQTAPASSVLPDSVKVRVTDVFGFNVAGVSVSFAVTAGGGSVSPASVLTDAQGRAATQWTIGAAGAQQMSATVTGLTPLTVNATIATGGGPPVLFLGLDSIKVAIGRTRQVPVFLTNPTPSLLGVTLTMRDTIASWSASSVVIPAGANGVLPAISGQFAGATWAIASSTAGTDSVFVTVDSAIAFIDGFGYVQAALGDTIRTLVMLPEPAGPSGVTLTVVSTDSTAVLVAPGSGRGVAEDVCYGCADLRAAGPDVGKLLAPLAGTAVLTIPQGQISAQLVILPFSQGASTGEVVLQLTSPGFIGIGTTVQLSDPIFDLYSSDTELGVGQRSEVYVYRNLRLRRDELIRLRSLDTTVVKVDSLLLLPREEFGTAYARFFAIAPGSTQIVADYPGGTADTITITVYPGRLYPYTSAGSTVALNALISAQVSFGYDYFGAFYYGGSLAAPTTLTITSRDPSVIRTEFGQRLVPEGEYSTDLTVEAVGAGSTWVVFSAAGYGSDSLPFTVVSQSVEIGSNTARLAVGTTNPSFYVYRAGFGDGSAVLPITLTSTDPSVLRVLTPTLSLGAYNGYAYGRVEGVAAGTASIISSAPGIPLDTFTIQVFPPVLSLASYTFIQTIDPDSSQRSVSANVTDSVYSWYVADTLRVKLRSTDPSVLLVTDSVLTFLPGNSFASGGAFRAIAPGTARVLLDLPGYAPDTSAVITVRLPRFNFSVATFSLGRGLQGLVAVNRTTSTSTVLPFTVTVQGSGGVAVAAPADSFPIGVFSRLVTIRGGTGPGPDTVIVNAAGMTPDTLYVALANTRASFYSYATSLAVGERYDFVQLRMLNLNTFGAQQSRDTTWIRLTSRDTTVLQVSPDSVRIPAGATFTDPTLYGSTSGRAPGKAWLVATPSGVGAPDSVLITVRKPRLLLSDYGAAVIGMQEETYPYEYYVERDDALTTPLWVRLTSSAPGVVSVPDSVLIPADEYYASFQLTSGDTTGSAFVGVSADGYASSVMPVFVTRSHFDLYISDDLVTGSRSTVEVYRETSNYYAYSSLVPIPIRFTVGDTTIARMLPDTATANPFSGYDYFEWLYGLLPGRTSITVSDRRAGTFQELLPRSIEFVVAPRRLYGSTGPLFVTPGTSTGATLYLYDDGLLDSTWVRLQSVGGRFAPSADSVLLEYGYASYAIRGISEGTDTLVISAAGFATDSLIVRVTDGLLLASGSGGSTIRQGDSVLVTLNLQSASNQAAYVDPGPLTFNLATTAAIQATLGAGAISSVQATVNQSQISFWVKALSPGGGTLTVTNANFATHQVTFGTRSP